MKKHFKYFSPYIFLGIISSIFIFFTACSEELTTTTHYKTHSVQIKQVENNSSQLVNIEIVKVDLNQSLITKSSNSNSFEVNSSQIKKVENCNELNNISVTELNIQDKINCYNFELFYENMHFEETIQEQGLSSVEIKITFESGDYRTFAGWNQDYYEDSLVDDYGFAYIEFNQSKIISKLDPTIADLNATEYQELYLNLLINSPDDIQFSIDKNLSTGFGY